MSIQVQASQIRSHQARSKPGSFQRRIVHEDMMETIGSQRQTVQLLKNEWSHEEDTMVLTLEALFKDEDKQKTDHANVCDDSSSFESEESLALILCRDDSSTVMSDMTDTSDEELEGEDKQKTGHANNGDYSSPFESKESPALIFCRDDSSTVISEMTEISGDELEDEVWDLRDYPSAVTDFQPYSWTFHIYNNEHQAGDTVWFRATCNGTTGYQEFEDTEIIEFAEMILDRNPHYSFYLKLRCGSSDDESSTAFFKSDRILRALTLLIVQSDAHDKIEIPSISSLCPTRAEPERTKTKKKKRFLSWFFRVWSFR